MADSSSLIGQTISHYHIFERLGGGGMGVVYKAEKKPNRHTIAGGVEVKTKTWGRISQIRRIPEMFMRFVRVFLVVLLSALTSTAATQQSPVLKTGHDISVFMQTYYLRPQPELIAGLIDALHPTGYLEKTTAVPPLVAFFSEVFAANPDRQSQWQVLIQKQDEQTKAALERAVSLSKAGGVLKLEGHSAELNDMYWGAYFAGGNVDYLKKLMEQLRYFDERDDFNLFMAGGTAEWSLASNAQSDILVRHQLEAAKLNADTDKRTQELISELLSEGPSRVKEEMKEILRKQREAGKWRYAPANTGSGRIQNIAPEEMWKRVTQCVLPTYPGLAFNTHITGTVDIGLGISPEGDVDNSRVLDGPPLLAESAMDAIRQWKFRPNIVQGEVTWSRVRALVRFNADGTTAVELAPAILADNFGDPGTPRSAAAAFPRPASSPECKPVNEPVQAPKFVDGAYMGGIGGIGFPSCVACRFPSYTDQARSAKVSGTVVLHLVITAEGRAENIQVQHSLGYGLDEKAVKAVRNWQFKPAVGPEGKPVPVWTDIEVNFQINSRCGTEKSCGALDSGGARLPRGVLTCTADEAGGFLVDALATTFGTLDVAFFVFNKSKGDFQWFLEIFAVELIARHTELRNARAARLLLHPVR